MEQEQASTDHKCSIAQMSKGLHCCSMGAICHTWTIHTILSLQTWSTPKLPIAPTSFTCVTWPAIKAAQVLKHNDQLQLTSIMCYQETLNNLLLDLSYVNAAALCVHVRCRHELCLLLSSALWLLAHLVLHRHLHRAEADALWSFP